MTDRLTELLALRARVDAEIAATRATVLPEPRNLPDLRAEIVTTRKYLDWLTSLLPPPRRSRLEPAECGTESGYQRHRYLARRDNAPWPLPADDPCGCRAAHTAHEARRMQRREPFDAAMSRRAREAAAA